MDELVSRQTLLKLMGEEPFNWTDSDKELQEIEDYRNFRNMVEQLPPVTLQPNTGHWIEQIDHEENCRTLICSNCDRPALHDGDSIWKHKFCPHCGAKMD